MFENKINVINIKLKILNTNNENSWFVNSVVGKDLTKMLTLKTALLFAFMAYNIFNSNLSTAQKSKSNHTLQQ